MTIPPDTTSDDLKSSALNEGLITGLSEIKNFSPDVLGIQEVDELQPRSAFIRQTEIIAKELAAPYWAFAPTMMGTPGEQWRALSDEERKFFHSGENLPASYGIALVSKIPVIRWHTLNLKKSPFGFPIAVPGKKRAQLIYVADEPRVALAAELENGWTIATTHLSFVPLYNVVQLRKLIRWLSALPGKKILIGDMNLPWGIARRVSGWQSFNFLPTYPSWKPQLEFDYILSNDLQHEKVTTHRHKFSGISDHLPLSIEIEL